MGFDAIYRRLTQMAADAAKDADRRMRDDIYTRIYLYFRASGPGRWGELITADGEHVPQHAELVFGEPLRRDLTVTQLAASIRTPLDKLPLLPY